MKIWKNRFPPSEELGEALLKTWTLQYIGKRNSFSIDKAVVKVEITPI
jgi:hypothetical protein